MNRREKKKNSALEKPLYHEFSKIKIVSQFLIAKGHNGDKK
jgi:hypothetical protein